MRKPKPFRVYISGKIGGLDLDTAKANFKLAEQELEAKGYETVNPFDWRRSKGARIERIWAQFVSI